MATDQVDGALANRIWLLQYGPCWCRSPRTDSSSFDYVRMRRTAVDLGELEEYLFIVSERVIDGAAKTYRQVYADVPDPKLVISAAACPTAERFWNDLPNGWTPVDEILPVDIYVKDCISGQPEALTAAVLGHVLAGGKQHPVGDIQKVSLGG